LREVAGVAAAAGVGDVVGEEPFDGDGEPGQLRTELGRDGERGLLTRGRQHATDGDRESDICSIRRTSQVSSLLLELSDLRKAA
jgi:hypothetical protein